MYRKTIIAHRGASKYAKDNSIASFTKAIELNADMVELDVRKTKDDVFVVCHDATLRGHLVSKLKYDEMQKIDQDIPTVAEVIALTKGKVGLVVELKIRRDESSIVELLRKHLPDDDFMIVSFHAKSLARVKASYPGLRVGLLLAKYQPKNLIFTSRDESLPVKWANQLGADFLLIHWRLLTPERLEIAKENNKSVFVWVVNDPEMMKRVLGNDLIDGIITDDPDTAVWLQNELLKGN